MLGLLLEGALVIFALLVNMASLLAARSSSLWSSYCHHLQKRPILTKAATGVVGSIIGDAIAQYGASRTSRSKNAVGFSYDVPRVTRLCAYSALIGSPIGHYWFQFLDKFIFPHAMAHPITAVVKTLLDQAIMAPAGIGMFFACMAVLEGQKPAEAWETTKQKFKPTLMANYLLWPAANLINFAFVPPAQRILYCNVVYIFWASFLSTMANKKTTKGELQRLDPALAQKEM